MTTTTMNHAAEGCPDCLTVPLPLDELDPRLPQMQEDVYAVNLANGWFDSARTPGEDRALLHSEVSEALEAFRRWGLEDATGSFLGDPTVLPKPEGVGSELADVLIRLLDTTKRHGYPLYRCPVGLGPDVTRFGDAVDALHDAIAVTKRAAEAGVESDAFDVVLGVLCHTAEVFGIDLMAEYDRKLAYNRTRGHRHGGKNL